MMTLHQSVPQVRTPHGTFRCDRNLQIAVIGAGAAKVRFVRLAGLPHTLHIANNTIPSALYKRPA